MLEDYSAHQQKIIKRYYQNQPAIQLQKLSELVTELYLAEGKKKERVWLAVGSALQKLELPASRVQHLLAKKSPELIAEVVKELLAKAK